MCTEFRDPIGAPRILRKDIINRKELIKGFSRPVLLRKHCIQAGAAAILHVPSHEPQSTVVPGEPSDAACAGAARLGFWPCFASQKVVCTLAVLPRFHPQQVLLFCFPRSSAHKRAGR